MQIETDNLLWNDPSTGYRCSIYKNEFEVFCAYVAVGKKHPFFRLEFYNENLEVIHRTIHGGLTFARYLNNQKDEWEFGFDCGHGFDFVPGLD